MAMIATDIKSMLSITIKSRHDSYTDQYNRIFMVKILLVSCLIMGISWFQDSITCIVPGTSSIEAGFVSAACWIQGVYVYKELQSRVTEVAYFGIPKDMDADGMLSTGELCSTLSKFNKQNKECLPMHKTFFLQYQWMPFLIASLAILYYIPYIAFRSANTDMISLRSSIKAADIDAEKIAKHYFNIRMNSRRTMTLRVVFNILIKVLYIVVNLVAFLGLDNLLNGEYVGYGSKWLKWSQLENSVAYDYMGMRDHPKPGNVLLPPFGYCEMYESSKDIKHSSANKHKFLCELSQNILYQYCLVVLWFAIVLGIIFSVLGLLFILTHYAFGLFGVKTRGPTGNKLFKALSFRELEYLEFLRKKNIILYGEVLEKLKDNIIGPNAPSLDDEYSRRPNDTLPLYPSLPPKSDLYDEKGVRY
ncbi:innexin inx3 isoform X1 [Hydra vulgaris]|uniref:innexin inx3 isoform X1 n=2 Tax=Hydra vulgaris TaxID=6087 RepID=UPI0001924562|nr:innexin inx3 [Hydra vulgaris]XP_047145464.1 innexin inx3 [Hydra vulgaris]